MSTDGVHFCLKVEDTALVALFMVHHEPVFEAYLTLSIEDVVLGLATRSDGFWGNVLVSSLVFLVAFHLLELFLDQLHGFVLLVFWGRFWLMDLALVLAVESHAPSELLEHVQFDVFQEIFLEDFFLFCLELDAALELLDGHSIAEQVWDFVDPLLLFGYFQVFLWLWVTLGISSLELIADSHVFVVTIMEIPTD